MTDQPQDAAKKQTKAKKTGLLTTLNIPLELHDSLQKRWHRYCVENDVNIPFGDWHNTLFKTQIVDCTLLPPLECKSPTAITN